MNASTSQAYGDDALELDEVFLQRVDRATLLSKQTDPFQQKAAWRATEEEARLRQLQLREGIPVRTTIR